MGEHVIRLPDVGEGIAEAEIVEWHVKVGDLVREDAVLAAVMTDKTTVEIPSPVDGEIAWLGAEIGDRVPVGSELVRLKVPGEGNAVARSAPQPAENRPGNVEILPPASAAPPKAVTDALTRVAAEREHGRSSPDRPSSSATPQPEAEKPRPAAPARPFAGSAPRPEGEKPLASPAVRLRAREAGIDLRQIPGTGPAGRITHEDLDAVFAHGRQPAPASGLVAKTSVDTVKVTGLRRRIAERMALANARVPHITYVEEIDVTPLEALRETLNAQKRPEQTKLTVLPFLMRAMVRAIAEQPALNALYDDEAGVIHQHAGVHIGIAAQTPSGLVVPVVKHAEARDLWNCAAEVGRLAAATKAGTATRDDLTGSTITITSLGAMGGVVTTPIINVPEVAIIGVNKIMIRPSWDGSAFVPRKMMNLSSSFDHRVIDGWDAAVFVQRLKTLLETPALIFVEG